MSPTVLRGGLRITALRRSGVEDIQGIPHSETRSGFVSGEGRLGSPERAAEDGNGAVDQANDILHSAHIEYLLVRDHNGRCEGLALAAIAMRIKHLAVWPVVDDDGYILGVLTADRASGLLDATQA